MTNIFFESMSDVVRINLSHYAWNVLNNDNEAFASNTIKEPKLSNLMNILLQNHFELSPANLQNNIDNKVEQILNFTQRVNFSKKFSYEGFQGSYDLNQAIKYFTYLYQIILYQEFNEKHEGGCVFNLRLQNTTKELLDSLGICNQSNYNHIIYGVSNGKLKLSKMLKSFFEAYCRMPFYQRELIYRKKIVEKINTAISNEKALSVVLLNDASFDVLPYKIMTNTSATYNYMIGLSRLQGADNEYAAGCFRLSRIKKVHTNPRLDYALSTDDIKSIEEEITQKGVEFIGRKKEVAKIKLTSAGFSQYCSRIHLRPPYTVKQQLADGSYELLFNTPLDQLKFYFFSFGADAEVIEPEVLRSEFLSMYSAAAYKYY